MDGFGTLERVGEVWVDAGMLLIGDPCYLIPNGDGTPKKASLLNWNAFCAAVHASPTRNGIAEPIGKWLGVVINNFGGDGTFPVDVVRGADGTVEKLIVTFHEPESEESEWEYYT